MADVDSNLSQILISISKLEQDKKNFTCPARRLQRSIQPISGSADDDQKEIDEADAIRLHTINVIHNLLRSV